MSRRRSRGLTLVELMISVALGILIVSAAGAVFMSNQQTYRATESLGRVQENSIAAFELMAREIREAGGSACDSSVVPATVLNGAAAWWATPVANGLRGYENGALFTAPTPTPAQVTTAAPLPTTAQIPDALELVSSTADVFTMNRQTTFTDPVTLTVTTHGYVPGNIIEVCDFQCATIFQDTASSSASGAISHGAGAAAPGNAVATLSCSASDPTNHLYGADALVGKLRATRWYIATNPEGVRSLYRAVVDRNNVPTAQQIVEGVVDMQLSYLERGDAQYTDATGVANWAQVTAVRIDLTMLGQQRVGTAGTPISRTLTHIVAIRNRSL